MPDFGIRVILLLSLMAIVAVVDFRRNGRTASKHREYGFILVAGIVGAVTGLCNDLITSSISPEYFIYGKGLDPGEDLRWRAGIFGVKEGLSAGIIGGAICLFATTQRSGLTMDRMNVLLATLWMPLAGAVLIGLALPILAGKFDPMRISSDLNSFLNTEQITRFLRVWWIHSGLYLGMAVGLAAMIVRTRSGRERIVSPTV